MTLKELMLNELMRGYKDRDIIEKICNNPKHRITLFDFLEHVAVGSLAYDLYCEYHDKGHVRPKVDLTDPKVNAEYIKMYREEESTIQDMMVRFGATEHAIIVHAQRLRGSGVDLPPFKYHDENKKNKKEKDSE